MIPLDTIVQGDCLEVMPGIPDKSIDTILCDLPYGTTACHWDQVIPFEPLWKEYKRLIKDRGAIVLTASQPFTSALVMSNPRMFRYELIWNKRRSATGMNADKMPMKVHEDICVFYKKLPTYNPLMTRGEPFDKTKYNGRKWDTNVTGEGIYNSKKNEGTRYPTSIIEMGQDWMRQDQLHPTQKPVALFEYLIKTYTNEGDLVLDNCIGSGTTAIAARNTGRHFIGIELSEEYCEIARKRVASVPARLDRWEDMA
jgi:site-specific DNA-methyltransferase (adenine-specific)